MDNNPLRVISDRVLETLICKKCFKYLTVSPIGISPDSGYICGRCLDKKKSISTYLFEYAGDPNFYTAENLIPMSLLGYATYSKVLFPCVNRFEGCSKLLPFSSIKNHESTCNFKKDKCPLCQFEGVGSQLIYHFKTFHKRYLSLDESTFRLSLNKDFSEIYLYRAKNVLFLVKIQYIQDINQFLFDNLCLVSTTTKTGNIKLVFKIPCGGISTFEEYLFESDRLVISKKSRFNMTFKISDFHFCEAKKIVCSYKIICDD